ncbi:unnamed protein product [Brassica rapa subsp. trilocularis]
MFKVGEETGTASIVLMNGDLAAADGFVGTSKMVC